MVRRRWRRVVVGGAMLLCGALHGSAQAGVPLAGFQPLVSITLTDEFKDQNSAETFFLADNAGAPTGGYLSANGSPHFELALLDTGAGASLITDRAHQAFDIDGNQFDGTVSQRLGGATGFFEAIVSDPLGIYATGVGQRTGSSPLAIDTTQMVGQTSVAILSLPPESELPSVLGLPFASQRSTLIHADQPQIFRMDDRTVRTPNITFDELGAGGTGITRRAPIILKPSDQFLQPPPYIFNFENILGGEDLTENPSAPTLTQGGLFLKADFRNDGTALGLQDFFFDTGADVTVLSELNMALLGHDPVLDTPDFTIPITGSGGTLAAVPGFYIDEIRVATIGGTLILTNVPAIALDVTDPSSAGNIVPGILGTNLFAGRNLVIDPNPSIGGGGVGPSLFISDPVTTSHVWAATTATADWHTPNSWNAAGIPDVMWAVTVSPVIAGAQTATVAADSTVWSLNVAGNANDTAKVVVENGATLTTFSGIEVLDGGQLHLSGGNLDAQYVENLGGKISGSGQIEVGNGPIVGQLENRAGTIAPGDGIGSLRIIGGFANRVDGILEFELGGTAEGTYDTIVVDGSAVIEGELHVSLFGLGADAFVPQSGDQFTLISASGAIVEDLDSLTLPLGYNWAVESDGQNLLLLVESTASLKGDYNHNGIVDAADYTVWKDSIGSQVKLDADGNGNGIIDAADYTCWKDNFGQTAGSVTVNSVPEPAAIALLFVPFLLARRWTTAA
ncbi:MAG: hypothetical protein KDA99_28340, partial [Planctomycetales bacterium]|nr:hypothetical protein [Planctomycetales bacterium]